MAGTLPDKPFSRRKAEPAAAPGDEIARRGGQLHPGFGSARGDRGTIDPVHRQNYLADMARVLHAAERLDGSGDRKDPVRQRHKNPLIEERRKLGEKLFGESGAIDQ